ncbi:hypothetical protein Cgig2_009436 [Carnegiea gigantea]|uniref:Uncharacterized protein n=1 Tax=Carnegiea gigantea TaxID=171969 RepID=A0A9Q1K6U0_9CARY|nr:hypothetical protein Cgig2_009436 [Carnegiea gigantea]
MTPEVVRDNLRNRESEMLSNADLLDDAFQEMGSFDPQFDVANSTLLDSKVNWRRGDVESDIVDASELSSSSMNNEKKQSNFKPSRPNKPKKLANLKNGEQLELTFTMGGKEGQMPTVAEIFKETQLLKSGALNEDSASTLEEIIGTSNDDPYFSTFLIEEWFRP